MLASLQVPNVNVSVGIAACQISVRELNEHANVFELKPLARGVDWLEFVKHTVCLDTADGNGPQRHAYSEATVREEGQRADQFLLELTRRLELMDVSFACVEVHVSYF